MSKHTYALHVDRFILHKIVSSPTAYYVFINFVLTIRSSSFAFPINFFIRSVNKESVSFILWTILCFHPVAVRKRLLNAPLALLAILALSWRPVQHNLHNIINCILQKKTVNNRIVEYEMIEGLICGNYWKFKSDQHDLKT